LTVHRRWPRPIAVLFSACGVLAGAPAASSAQPHAELRARLQNHLDSLVATTGVPGVTVGVALPDGSHFGIAAGWADTLTNRRMRPDDRMLQGSVGKTYFGAVALQLVGEGRLDLDAHLTAFLGDEPWFDRLPNARDVTIRHLMMHTSGIVRYELNPRFLEDLTADPMRTWTPEDRLSYLFDTQPAFPAGDGWDYSDTNYILLAMVLERITGAPAYDEIRRRILSPLGLSNTVPSDRPDVPGIVQGYGGPENPFGGFTEMVRDGRLVLNPQFEWGGGGFASTTEDLARWVRDIHEGRAFGDDLLEQARTGVAAPLGPGGQYGLGVIMLELPAGTAWGHSGFMPGYRTEMYYFPDDRFGVALQINSTDRAALRRPLLMVLSNIATIVATAAVAAGVPGR
jgi:D-alanyl-D-alanine carboxypeptidase